MNYLKKALCNGGLFVLLMFFTYKMIFSKLNLDELLTLIKHSDMRFILCGLLVASFMVCAEAYNVKRNLLLLGENKRYSQCLTYAFAGNFFSGITPAATGGQPMQLFFMCKDHLLVSKGTLALLMDFCAYQVSIVGLALIGYISYFERINRSLGSFIPILWIGIVINILLLILAIIAMFSDQFIYTLIYFVTKIVHFFSKDKAIAFKEKALLGVEHYKTSANILKANKKTYFFNTLITVARVIAMHSAPFWIYKSLGPSKVSFFEMLSLQSTLYISCAALPLPGGVGVGESAFLLYFKEIFPLEMLESAMFLSRGIGFYFVLSVCGMALSVVYLHQKLSRK